MPPTHCLALYQHNIDHILRLIDESEDKKTIMNNGNGDCRTFFFKDDELYAVGKDEIEKKVVSVESALKNDQCLTMFFNVPRYFVEGERYFTGLLNSAKQISGKAEIVLVLGKEEGGKNGKQLSSKQVIAELKRIREMVNDFSLPMRITMIKEYLDEEDA